VSRFDLDRKDTICAPATAPGDAALAIVRVSGRDADAVRARVFRKKRGGEQRPFVATLGEVLDASAVGTEASAPLLDEALCTAFPDGRSYTGEPAFELCLHGGRSRVASTLRSLVAAGCRLAEPGELTLRAVLNGRMDLSEAEAVEDLIGARSDEAARAALRNLRGGLAAVLEPARGGVVEVLAELEARLDFPDEELGSAAAETLVARLDDADAALTRLLDGARLGRRLMEGARVVLYGLPNAGKSTLLNALVGEERALVHESPGTTRDVLEAETVFGGVPALLVDVAGVREGGDIHPVEQLGIERAKDELERADVQLLVVDGTSGDASDAADALAAGARDDALVLFTKRDLGAPPTVDGALAVSARSGDGSAALRAQLRERLTGAQGPRDEALLTRARQREETERALQALRSGRAALAAGEVHEVVASELRRAGAALDRLLGRSLDEDVLDVVFERFCIGK
jgi:tRNA modification GTPase